MNQNHLIALCVAVALILVGVCLGYLAWGRQTVAIEEKAAAPVWHDDGSLTAIRDPKAKPDLPAPSAPKGGRLVRTVEVTVKPEPTHKPPITDHNQPITDAPDCAPVTVRLDLHAYDDGLRVSAIAKGGEILDAVDIPRSEIYLARPTRHVIALERTGDETEVRYGRSLGAFDIGPTLTLAGGRAQVGGFVQYRF